MPYSIKIFIAMMILVVVCFIWGFVNGWYLCIHNYSGKFCPECGNRFETSVSYCDIDGTELREIHNRG